MNILQPFLFLLFTLLISACNLINPSEPIPAYIKIDTTYVLADYNTQGSASHNVTDAWVYTDYQLEGGYGLPTDFPILNTGNSKLISIRPGVELNGLSAVHVINPFYTTYDTTINLIPGETVYLKPRTTYISGAVFPWIEDFDDGSFSMEKNSSSDTIMYATSVNAFEGNQSGVFYLDTARSYIEYATYDKYTLPKNKINIIELNYNTENSIEIGLKKVFSGGSEEKLPVIVLKPSFQWKKIYLDLSSFVNSATGSPIGYKVYFVALLDGGLTSSKVMLDNFKLVHN